MLGGAAAATALPLPGCGDDSYVRDSTFYPTPERPLTPTADFYDSRP